MNYYQKYLKYKKKYLKLLNGGSSANSEDPINNMMARLKFCKSYYSSYSDDYMRNVYPIRCTDGGSDHYILYKEIDSIIYISFNIQKPKDNKNTTNENTRIDIIIKELNNLISVLNVDGTKKIIINIQECVKKNYEKLKENLICNKKKFSFTNLFTCSIFIAFCRQDKDKDTNYVGLDNNWLYGYQNDYTRSKTGINGSGNTDNTSCLCTFIYNPNNPNPSEIDARRAFMSSKIWEKDQNGIKAGTYEFITKAIYIPEYNIFNVHFDKKSKLNFKNFIEKFKVLNIFKIDHQKESKFNLEIQEQANYDIADILLKNYDDNLAKTLHTIPAYYYINQKLDSLYNFDITTPIQTYVLGDFNKTIAKINDDFRVLPYFRIIDDIKYKFSDNTNKLKYDFKNADTLNNYLDHMIQIPINSLITEMKEKEEQEQRRVEQEQRRVEQELKERKEEQELKERQEKEEQEQRRVEYNANLEMDNIEKYESYYKENYKSIPRKYREYNNIK
jgi:hypothetical protein